MQNSVTDSCPFRHRYTSRWQQVIMSDSMNHSFQLIHSKTLIHSEMKQVTIFRRKFNNYLVQINKHLLRFSGLHITLKCRIFYVNFYYRQFLIYHICVHILIHILLFVYYYYYFYIDLSNYSINFIKIIFFFLQIHKIIIICIFRKKNAIHFLFKTN